MFARSLLRVAAVPALAAVGLAGTAAVAAPVPFGGNTYDLVLNDDVTWSGARDAAASAGGSLAVISSAEEQTFIRDLLADRNAPTGSYWFGLEETDSEGFYEPVGSNTLSFSSFAPMEPNDAGGLGESFGAIYWTADGGDPATLPRRGDWNDLPEEGYPNDGELTPAQADLFRAGYLVEFPGVGSGNGDGDGDGTSGGDGSGSGDGDGDGDGGLGGGDGDGDGDGGLGGGDGDGDGDGGLGGGDGDGGLGGDGGGDGGGDPGSPNAIPIPPALVLFPTTALLAIVAGRRMKRR